MILIWFHDLVKYICPSISVCIKREAHACYTLVPELAIEVLFSHLNSPDQRPVVPSTRQQPLAVRTEAHRLHTPRVT